MDQLAEAQQHTGSDSTTGLWSKWARLHPLITSKIIFGRALVRGAGEHPRSEYSLHRWGVLTHDFEGDVTNTGVPTRRCLLTPQFANITAYGYPRVGMFVTRYL